MKKTLEISGSSLAYLYYAATSGALVLFLFAMVWTPGSFASVPLAVFFASLVLATVVGLWRAKTGREGEHLGTVEDLAYNPLAPGQMAKESWLKSIRRFSAVNDEDEGDEAE